MLYQYDLEKKLLEIINHPDIKNNCFKEYLKIISNNKIEIFGFLIVFIIHLNLNNKKSIKFINEWSHNLIFELSFLIKEYQEGEEAITFIDFQYNYDFNNKTILNHLNSEFDFGCINFPSCHVLQSPVRNLIFNLTYVNKKQNILNFINNKQKFGIYYNVKSNQIVSLLNINKFFKQKRLNFKNNLKGGFLYQYFLNEGFIYKSNNTVPLKYKKSFTDVIKDTTLDDLVKTHHNQYYKLTWHILQ